MLQLLPTSAALQQQFSRPSHVTWSQVLPAKLMRPYTDATQSPLPHPGPSSENDTSDSNLKRAPPLQDTESPPALMEPSLRVLAAGRAYRVVYTLQLVSELRSETQRKFPGWNSIKFELGPRSWLCQFQCNLRSPLARMLFGATRIAC